MAKSITIRPRASQDLDDHFAYIAQRNAEAALSFFDAVRFRLHRSLDSLELASRIQFRAFR